jgi:hypothetical protein
MKILLFITCLFASAIKAQEPAQLLAGTAKVEITPAADQAVNLVGQPLQLRDPLFARVLVLKTPQTSMAIVSVDLIVFASKKVIDEAKAKYGLDHLILCATHTHAAPAPRGMIIKPPAAPDWTRSPKAPAEVIDWPGLSADPWYAAIEAKVIAAIGQATQNLFLARLAAGKGPFESAFMAHNRRLVRAGIVGAMWENPDRRPTKPVDPTVGVIRVEDMTGKPRALAVQYACHPVTLMGAGVVSRDYPGAMVDHIEQELGPDCMAMLLQGNGVQSCARKTRTARPPVVHALRMTGRPTGCASGVASLFSMRCASCDTSIKSTSHVDLGGV